MTRPLVGRRPQPALFWKVKDKNTGATLDGLTRLAIIECPSIMKMACFSEIVPGTRRSGGQCGAAEKHEPDFFQRWKTVLHYSTQEGSLQWANKEKSWCTAPTTSA